MDQQTVRAEVRGVIQGLCRISCAIEFCGTTSHLVEATFGTAVCMVVSDRQEQCGMSARDGHCDFEIYPFGLEQESFMVSTRRPLKYLGDQFRTDAKCNDGLVILAGGNSSPGVGSHCVFTPGMPHIFSNPTVSHSGHPLLQS